MNNIYSVKQVRDNFADILNQVIYNQKEFIISRFNRPVAKISPLKKQEEHDKETNRREHSVEKILAIRRRHKNLNLTKIVINERDKEYKRWKR